MEEIMEVGGNSRKREHVSINIVNEDDVLLSSIKEKNEEHVLKSSIKEKNEEDVLLSSIKGKMEFISLSHYVCRVPEELFKGNEEKYFPLSVSIGPFHHGQATDKLMDDQKWRYLNALLSRKPDAEATVGTCIRALKKLEQKARKFYGETIEMESDQFVEMLLLDGCFIIELFLVYAIESLRRRDDPCFTYERLFRLRCDLILFENQLPFFILDHLFHLVPIPKNCHLSFIELALYFFKKLIPHHPNYPQQIFSPQTHHLLDLIRQPYLPTSPQRLLPSTVGHAYITNATRLSDVGICIEKTICKSPSNITFSNGRLNIPSLEVHSYTEILFRNLIAMEQCQPGCSKHVTSYVALMEQLIRSKRDVRLLQDKEILTDGHEREVEIVLLFKSLHVDVNVKEFYYRRLCGQVSRHQRRKRDVCWVRMRDLYHGSNFGIAGFSLVVVLLVFLFTGAFFTAVSLLLHHFQ